MILRCAECDTKFENPRRKLLCSARCQTRRSNRLYKQVHRDEILTQRAEYRKRKKVEIAEYNKVMRQARAVREFFLDEPCLLCGATEHLHLHHLIAIKDGGRNNLSNLVILCFDCHALWHSKAVVPHLRKAYPNLGTR